MVLTFTDDTELGQWIAWKLEYAIPHDLDAIPARAGTHAFRTPTSDNAIPSTPQGPLPVRFAGPPAV